MSTAFVSGRVCRPELLDHSPPADAACSLADLRRINRYFGGHRLLRSLLRGFVSTSESFSLLEIGAGSGDNSAVVASSFPRARVTLLDYRHLHLSEARTGSRVVADAFAAPFAPGSFDFVFSSLFLHHFSEEQVVELLAKMRCIARKAVLATDLERTWLAYHFLPATRWLFRWHPITMHDGPASVQAGFRRDELADMAHAAGLTHARIRAHRPWFRLSLAASKR